jgi:methionyl-tRNA synthetase
MAERKRYFTTPLYYVNARPHLGHAYATVLGDVLTRHSRQRGIDTLFLTGTDEHGEKIATKAAEAERTPLEFATENSNAFREAWEKLGLKPDIFYRTTLPSHYALVQAALQQLKDRGEIYFASYEGKYCVGCERFRTDQEWNEQGLCPDHLTPPEIRKESNYFFKMGAYQERLKEHYKAHPEAIVPGQYMKEALSFLEQPLEDLCISRPVSRLKWGIPLPFDKDYVTYVWFDALLNYPGGLGYEGKPMGENPKFDSDMWKHAHHIIGKDILKTHAIYWPTMLFALGLPCFERLQVSGYWLTSGMKMSKSLGNVVEPVKVSEQFGNDPFRYYLLREMSYGGDSNFTWENFILRSNADLANGIGNLASRTLTLSHKNLEAKIPTKSERKTEDEALLKQIHALPAQFAQDFEACRYHMALAAWAEGVAACDRYINDQKPWALAKNSATDPAQKDRLAAVLGTAMDALWTLSVVAAAVIPEGTAKLRAALGRPDTGALPAWESATHALEPGTQLGEVPRLYPRLELPKEN